MSHIMDQEFLHGSNIRALRDHRFYCPNVGKSFEFVACELKPETIFDRKNQDNMHC